MAVLTIGVDVGNYDVKTQSCVIISGYKEYDVKPEIAVNVLSYNGKFYVPDISERMPYVSDKTQTEQCIILTLLGIAEEIIHVARERDRKNIQNEIDKIRHIKLGVGLPPGHMTSLKKKTEEYYANNLSGEVVFSYKKYNFRIVVDKVRIFPQDFIAVYKNEYCETAKKKHYYIIGIGGGTIDVTPVINGCPDVNGCFSLTLGTRIMYRQIAADIQRQYGEMLNEDLIEDVLRGEDTVLNDNIKELIHKGANKHLNNFLNECIQQGVKLNLYPVVFFGGGCLLLEENIKNSPILHNPEIMRDIRLNAKAYAKYIDA